MLKEHPNWQDNVALRPFFPIHNVFAISTYECCRMKRYTKLDSHFLKILYANDSKDENLQEFSSILSD